MADKQLDTEPTPCPCTLVEPCHDRCTCVNKFSSSGCRRCCSYGNIEQRQAQACHLAGNIDERDNLRDAIRGLLPYVDTSKASAFRAIEAAEQALGKGTDGN